MIYKETIPDILVKKLLAIEFDQLLPLFEGGLVKSECKRKSLWVVMGFVVMIVALVGLKCLSFIAAAIICVFMGAVFYPILSFSLFYFYSKYTKPGLIEEYNQAEAYAKKIEGREGFLWQFEGFLKMNPNVLHCGIDKTVKSVLENSKRGKVGSMKNRVGLVSLRPLIDSQ